MSGKLARHHHVMSPCSLFFVPMLAAMVKTRTVWFLLFATHDVVYVLCAYDHSSANQYFSFYIGFCGPIIKRSHRPITLYCLNREKPYILSEVAHRA